MAPHFPPGVAASESSHLQGTLTGVVSHELLQAVELGAGGDVETAAVQFPDLVVFHIEALGIVEVGYREAVGTCGREGTSMAPCWCAPCWRSEFNPPSFSSHVDTVRQGTTPPPEWRRALQSSSMGLSFLLYSMRVP